MVLLEVFKTKLKLQQCYALCQNTRAGVTACIDSGHNPRIVQDPETTSGTLLKLYMTVDQSKILGIYYLKQEEADKGNFVCISFIQACNTKEQTWEIMYLLYSLTLQVGENSYV